VRVALLKRLSVCKTVWAEKGFGKIVATVAELFSFNPRVDIL
jgi:hypothetical protein